MDFNLIKELALKEPKTMPERMLKLLEECGELAQEVGINQNLSGFKHKENGADGISGECIDIMLVALSIFFQNGKSEEDLSSLVKEKCSKWQKHQS